MTSSPRIFQKCSRRFSEYDVKTLPALLLPTLSIVVLYQSNSKLGCYPTVRDKSARYTSHDLCHSGESLRQFSSI